MKLGFETDNGIGTRATLGAIVLSTDETFEPELAQMTGTLDHVALYHSRIPMKTDVSEATLAQMEADMPASAALLPQALDFDVIGYGCTSASSVIGSENVEKAIQSVFPKSRVTNPLAAIIAAGRRLGMTRIGFVTPYVPAVSARMRSRLEDAGFAIAGFGSFEEGDDRVVARITEASIETAARKMAETTDCDGIVIACTNLRCLNVIDRVERATGVPVLSSNQALGWHMLRLAGVQEAMPGMGRLFTCDLPEG